LEHQTSQNPFLNIPRRKLEDAVADTEELFLKDGIFTKEGAALVDVFNRYYNSNIPVDYWYRDMGDFIGPNVLKKHYLEFTTDVKKSFKAGKMAMFSSSHGQGKTYVSSCVLKRAVEKGYSALYVNLTDIINVLLSSPNDIKNSARELLLNVDFLVIDEFDTRFMVSDKAADLFGSIVETIIRTRIQNRMPLLMCTNSIKVEDSFSGPLKASMESLMKVIKLVPVLGGKDAREEVGKGNL
jgi:DNA replication protein DnaC